MVRWGRRGQRERQDQMEIQGLQVQWGLAAGLPALKEQRALKGQVHKVNKELKEH